VYDLLLLLGDEIEFIWRAPWTSAKVLFVWTRYSPLFELGTVIWRKQQYTCE
ncbi:hypothetical protein PHLGIDRAFT_71629, partial [Phlebiopsis gigantea 11061_1 CR5-6]